MNTQAIDAAMRALRSKLEAESAESISKQVRYARLSLERALADAERPSFTHTCKHQFGGYVGQPNVPAGEAPSEPVYPYAAPTDRWNLTTNPPTFGAMVEWRANNGAIVRGFRSKYHHVIVEYQDGYRARREPRDFTGWRPIPGSPYSQGRT